MLTVRRPSALARSAPLALRTLPALLAIVGVLPAPGGAAVHTFTGVNSGSWSDAANWTGGLPVIGGELLLDSATRPATFNDIAGGFTLLGLTLGANAPAPTLTGNTLRFQGDGAYLRMLSDGGHAVVDNTLALNSTLHLSGGPSDASQLLLGGNISGGGGLTVLTGRTVLSGNNSFSGATTVAAGAALGIAGGALAGTSSVQVAHGGELQLVSADGFTSLNKPIALGGRLSSGAQVLPTILGPLPGATVGGAITLTDSAEILAFTHSQASEVIFPVTGAIDLAGQSLTLRASGKGSRLDVASIGGSGRVVVQPDIGTVKVGSVDMRGELVLRPGSGAIDVGAVALAGPLTASGTSGSATVGSLAGNGRVLVDFEQRFGRLVIIGALDGQHDLEVRSGTLDLRTVVPLNFTGQITLSGEGTLSLGRESYLGSASPVLSFENGGRLELRDGFNLRRNITTSGGLASLSMGGATNIVSSDITGDGGFGVSGNLTLTGSNSFSGGLVIFNDGSINAAGQPNQSIVRFFHDGNLGAAGQGITMSGGLVLPDGYDLSRPLTLQGKLAHLTGSGDHRISSNITGDGRLNLGGAARYELTGTNTHTGGVALAGQANGQAAALVIDSDARLGSASGVLNIGRASGIFTLPGTLVAAGNLDIAATRSTTFRAMTVDTNGFDVVFNQPIAGRGMSKAGAGTWSLNTANSDSSGDNLVNVLQGTLSLGVDEALGSRSLVDVGAGSRLALNGHVLTAISLNSVEGSTVDLGAGGTLRPLFGSLDGALIGQGQLRIGRDGFSPGAVTLNGANSFAGAIVVSHGSRLTVGHVAALGAASNRLTLDQGTLEASNRLAAPLVISDGMNLQIGAGGAGFVAGGQSIVIERAMSGPLALSIQGGSMPWSSEKIDVRLAHRNNTFTGDLQLGDPQGFGGAVLGITAEGSLGAAGNRLILGKSLFDGESTRSAQGGLRAWDSLTLGPTRTVLLDGTSGDLAGFIDTNGHTVVLNNSIGERASDLGLLKTGTGTLVLNGVQAYTGLTLVEAGTLGGRGEVERLAVQAATLAPGDSAGLFSVRQDLSFSGGALLSLTLGGPGRDNGHGALSVGTLLDLGQDSTLRLSLGQGFSVQAGQQFDLLDWGSLHGQFSMIDSSGLALAPGLQLDVSRLYIDGVVGVTAVPEPQSWAMLLSGLLGLLAWRRRQQRPA